MNPIDWFALLHPVLVILFVYPVVGATVRLGILARERRLKIHPQPPTVGVEHADHGRWLTVVGHQDRLAGSDPAEHGGTVVPHLAVCDLPHVAQRSTSLASSRSSQSWRWRTASTSR